MTGCFILLNNVITSFSLFADNLFWGARWSNGACELPNSTHLHAVLFHVCAIDIKSMRIIILLVNVHLFSPALLHLISWTVTWWKDDDHSISSSCSSSHGSTEGSIERSRRERCSQQRHNRRRFEEGEIRREDEHEDHRRATKGPAGSFEDYQRDAVIKGWCEERAIEASSFDYSRSGANRRRGHGDRRKRKRKHEKRLRWLRRLALEEIGANLEYLYSTVPVVIVFILLFRHSNAVFIALLSVSLFDDNSDLMDSWLDCSRQTMKFLNVMTSGCIGWHRVEDEVMWYAITSGDTWRHKEMHDDMGNTWWRNSTHDDIS